MRLREQSIGALNLFHDHSGLADVDLRIAQALADVATIGILHQQGAHTGNQLIGQLQSALNSRVAIEQAKGVLAHTAGSTWTRRSPSLRRHARSNNLKLGEVADALVHGNIQPGDLIIPRQP